MVKLGAWATAAALLWAIPAHAAEPVTLRFLSAFESGEMSAWQKVIAAYEAQHPEVRIKLDAIGGSGAAVYPDVLRTGLTSGNPPDLFTNWGGEVAGPFIDAGQVQEVSAYYAQYHWNDGLAGWAIDAVRRHGKLYGVPFRARGMGLWYNKDVFAKYGIAEPKTFAGLEQICRTLKEHQVACVSVGGKYGWDVMRMVDYFLEVSCGPDVHDALDHLKTGWDQPCVVQAYDRMANWTKQGWFVPDFLNVSPNDSRMPVYLGEAAMMPEGDWMEAVIKTDEQPVSRFDFFLPPTDHEPLRYSAFAEQLMIPANARHADATEAFVAWTSLPETQAQFPEAFVGSATAATKPDCADWPRTCKWRALIGSSRRTYLPTDQEFPKELMDSFFEVQDGVIAGNLSPAAGASLMQQRAADWAAKHPT